MLAIVGGLFVLETVSVIVQVISFKLTGKRVFRMAPIHHHYEQLGWNEPTIVIRFWIVAVVLALARPCHPEAAVTRMIAAARFRGQDRRRLRAGPHRAWRGARAEGGRRAGDRLGRQQRRARLGGQDAGAEIMPWREWPWDKIAALVLSARRAADPSRAA